MVPKSAGSSSRCMCRVSWCIVVKKEDSFADHSAALLLYGITYFLQQVDVILGSYCDTILQVICENNTLFIPEDGEHDLSCGRLHSGLLRGWRRCMFPMHRCHLGFWFKVMNPRFIHDDQTGKKSIWILITEGDQFSDLFLQWGEQPRN